MGAVREFPFLFDVAGLSRGHVTWLLRNWQRKDLDVVGVWETDRDLAVCYAER